MHAPLDDNAGVGTMTSGTSSGLVVDVSLLLALSTQFLVVRRRLFHLV